MAAVHGLNLERQRRRDDRRRRPVRLRQDHDSRFRGGFIKPKSGRVLFDGVDVTDRSPQQRSIGYVFQDYAIYPHMTVRENIRFPLDAAKMPRARG